MSSQELFAKPSSMFTKRFQHPKQTCLTTTFSLVVALVMCLAGCAQEPDKSDTMPPAEVCARQELIIKGHKLLVEVADTPELRSRGLMHRQSLGKNEGMLFVFKNSGYRGFWMKNTSIPLNIAFINEEGYIDQINAMTPFDETTIHESSQPCRYTLEVNKGWFERHGITQGDQVTMGQTRNL